MPPARKMSHTCTFRIPATHPALPGHFPGRPVVPGAVTLSEVVAAWQAHAGSTRPLRGFAHVKFLSPLLPEEIAQIVFTDKGAGSAGFEITVEARRVVSGALRYDHD
jgi:3-hydroxymyristoyl/3-hydroxydecanoyl-(acyl carrier protein) dehydratase